MRSPSTSLARFTLCLVLISLLPALAFAKQSTTGPVPPPGIDRGLREWSRSQILIPGVPAYYWHHGCGPTALGMVIGYYDGQGFPELVPGSAATQTAEVDAMIANDGGQPDCDLADGDHYQDYSCPLDYVGGPILPDRSQTGGAHTNNCVADFMKTSWSSLYNYYGWSYDDDVTAAFRRYVRYVSDYEPASFLYWFSYFSWDSYKTEIDAGRPLVLLVDSDGDGTEDHFVTAIGYDDTAMEFAIYDTWDLNVHWYEWKAPVAGDPWGVGVFIICSLTHPASACCIHGTCQILTEQECLAAGGEWVAGIASCDPFPCPQGIADGPVLPSRGPWVRCEPNPVCSGARVRFSIGGLGSALSQGDAGAAGGLGDAAMAALQDASPARLDLGIYDPCGRLVRRLTGGFGTGATRQVTWDGRGDTGDPVASGAYLLLLTAGEKRAGQWITVVR